VCGDHLLGPFSKKKKKKACRKVSGGVRSSQDIAMLIEDRNPNW
jgi:hypothetical protein